MNSENFVKLIKFLTLTESLRVAKMGGESSKATEEVIINNGGFMDNRNNQSSQAEQGISTWELIKIILIVLLVNLVVIFVYKLISKKFRKEVERHVKQSQILDL